MCKPRSSYFCLFLLGLVVSLPIQAVEWGLDKNPRPQAGPRPDELGLRGVWPNSCIPEIISVKVTADANGENSIQLLSRSEQTQCNLKPTPFSLYFSLPAIDSITPEFYWLHQDTTATTPRLLGFKLLSLSHGQADIRPASGWWWPEPGETQDSGPGTGLTVDYQNGLLTLLTQMFNAEGQPEWLLGTAPMRNGVVNTELIKFIHGQTLTGTFQSPLIAHSRNAIHIRFLSASRALVWIESRASDQLNQTIRLRKLTMVRYFMDPPILNRLLEGRWLLALEHRPDYARHARQFRILSVVSNGLEASLQFANKSSRGSCRLRNNKSDSPPHQCEIEIQTDQGQEKWIFTSFSLDRMRGANQHGARVSAFKIGPK